MLAMIRKLLAIFLILQSIGLIFAHYCLGQVKSSDNTLQHWSFFVHRSGFTAVTINIDNATLSELDINVPKTATNLTFLGDVKWEMIPIVGKSFNKLRIENPQPRNLNLTFNWPDGSIPFSDSFFFAGQEDFEVGPGSVTVILPEDSKIRWTENSNYLQSIGDTLAFSFEQKTKLPSIRYYVPDIWVEYVYVSRQYSRANLFYHPTVEPWINQTVAAIEKNWNWLASNLNSSYAKVNITLVPYGFNEVGPKFEGFTYYYSRDIFIPTPLLFDIGLGGKGTSVLFHELIHALMPLFEDLPTFYSEAIAEALSYKGIELMGFGESATLLETERFLSAYQSVETGLLDRTWSWKWNNTVYDNSTVMTSCYGVSAFIGDFLVHKFGEFHLGTLETYFNKTEIISLADREKISKFTDYLSQSFGTDLKSLFQRCDKIILDWHDSHNGLAKVNEEKSVLKPNGLMTMIILQQVDRLYEEGYLNYQSRDYVSSLSHIDDASYLLSLAKETQLIDPFITGATIAGIFWMAYSVARTVNKRRFAKQLQLEEAFYDHSQHDS